MPPKRKNDAVIKVEDGENFLKNAFFMHKIVYYKQHLALIFNIFDYFS